jgi:hypothetical protein
MPEEHHEIQQVREAMNFTGRDLSKIGLPLQIAGAVGLAIGIAAHSWYGVWIGAPLHLGGDILFFLQMKKQGCL